MVGLTWSGPLLALELVPAHARLVDLGGHEVVAEFNHDMHLPPDRRVWYFQRGSWVANLSRIDLTDSYCYLGTRVDLNEPKTYRKGEGFSEMKIVTDARDTVYFVNHAHERLFRRAPREDLYVVGCERRQAPREDLTVGDLYRHFAYNLVLKGRGARDISLLERASGSRAITKPPAEQPPFFRRLFFKRDLRFEPRPDNGFDRSRYTFQGGHLVNDLVNHTDLDPTRPRCTLRFHDDLDDDVTYRAGDEFTPVRQTKTRQGLLFESDQYMAAPTRLRSLRCDRPDGARITPLDILDAFGRDRVELQ